MNSRRAGIAKGDEKHEAHGFDNPAPEAMMSRDIINIGGNIFKQAIKVYAQDEQDELEWLWGYTFDILNGSRSALERELGIDYNCIYTVFTGRHEGALDEMMEAIDRLKIRASRQTRLIKTIVTEKIFECLNLARDTRAMVTITGSTGRGKTWCAKEWARFNNHGRSRYVRIPSGCSRATLIKLLCQGSGIGINGKKSGELEMRLYKTFDHRNVIIADEAGHLLPRAGTATSAIELLRDLHDSCGCGVVMIFTDVYLKEMRGGRLSDYFEQFIGRIKYELPIPPIRRDEIRQIVNHFRCEPPQDLVKLAYEIATARDGKLRALFDDLDRAKKLAEEKGVELDAKALRIATKWRLTGGVWPEDI